MIEDREIPVIVYLDQNKWIDLSRSYYVVNNESKFRNLLTLLQKLCEEGKLIMPLSVVHFTETQKESNIERRKKLAHLMTELSRGYTILLQEKVLDLEISNCVGVNCNETPINIRKEILGKGYGFALGMGTPILKLPPSVFESSTKEKQFHMDWKNHIESREIIYKHLVERDSNLEKKLECLRRGETEALPKVEIARSNAQRDLNKEQRYYVELIDLTDDRFVGKLISEVKKRNVNIIDLLPIGNLTKEEVDNFYENFPTMLVTVKLYWRRNEETQRRAKLNDGRDLAFLSVAIPYCDIVVIEKDWCSKAKALKLDAKYGTLLYRNLEELESYLQETFDI